MRGQREVLALIVTLAFLVPAAGALAGSDRPAPAQLQVLTVGMEEEMKTRNFLSPLAQDDPYTTAVLARVYDTAVQRNATTGAVVPRVAVGEDTNGNGVLDPAEVGAFDVPQASPSITVFYDFTNATFDGGPIVTIADVLFSYHLFALQPQMNGPLWVLMDQGGGTGSNFSTDRWLWVFPVNDGDGNPATAALRFFPQFPYADFSFATLGIPIFPRYEFEATGQGRHADWGRLIYPETDPRFGQGIPVSETTFTPFSYSAAEAWQMTDADVIGSGHFKFGTWSPGVYARLDANPYYVFGPPHLDAILFKTYWTTALGILALRSGEIDFLYWSLPSEWLPDLQNDPHMSIVSAPGLSPYSLTFNMRRLPFGYGTYPPADRTNDVGYPFRQAMQHLVDKPTMVRTLLHGEGYVAEGMIAPTNDGWRNTSLPAYAYNPSLAAQILDKAGWTDSDGNGWREFPRIGDSPFELLTPQADTDPIMASAGAMIASAARSVGINMLARPTGFGAMLPLMGARDFEMAIMGVADVHPADPWTLMRGDPDYLVDQFHSSNSAAGRNLAGFSDGPFDTQATASRREIASGARTTDVQDTEGVLATRAPVIPLYYRTSFWTFRSDRFYGWHLIASTLFNYWSLQGLTFVGNQKPQIVLVSPAAGSLIRPGTPVDLQVNDTNLLSVEYSVDGSLQRVLPAPYDVQTDSWTDGFHDLAVRAVDPYTDTFAFYSFRVDGTGPVILSVSPGNGALVAAGRIAIEVRFSEAVNRTSTEDAFSVIARGSTWRSGNGAFTWANNSTAFRYVPSDPFPEGTSFEVRLAGNLTDEIGNPMGAPYASPFATRAPVSSVVALGGIAAVILVAVLGLLFRMRRRRRTKADPPG